jgi:hypothetical protein
MRFSVVGLVLGNPGRQNAQPMPRAAANAQQKTRLA